MVIENRPGAAGIIGTEAVSHAAPDGNTLLLITPTFVLNPHLRKLNYDPLTSFGSICYLVRTPTVIVVNSASPYRTLADLMNAARAKPGELTLAATGPATPAQIAFEMLNVRGVAPRRLRVIAALELRPDRGAPGGDVFLAAAGYRRAAHHPEQHLRPISIPSQLMCHLPAGRGA
jgi:Tripartite tricarboxylate transporter family receptor